MAKKGKKRQLNEDEATDNKPIVKTTEAVGNKDLPKKKKLKTNPEDATVVEVQAANNANGAENSSKKSKKKKNKKAKKQENIEGSASEKSKPVQGDAEKSEVPEGDEASVNSKRKEKLKQKRKENKEIRKEVRKEEGNYSSVNKLSVEEMKKKIAEIEARETQSKTAIRKLRILKKKLSIEEGTIDTTPSPKRKSDALQGGANNQKNKKFKKDIPTTVENQEKNKEKIVNENANKKFKKDSPVKNESSVVKEESKLNTPNKFKKEKPGAKQVTEQPLFIEDRVGNKPGKSNKKKSKDSGEEESEVSRAKKILEQVLNEKKQKAKKVKVQNGDDEEDSENDEEPKKLAEDEDDEDEDDDEDDGDGDEDEDDDDDDVEESDEEDTATKINTSKINVKANKKLEKAGADDEDKNEEAEAEENKSQQSSFKGKEKKEKPKDFNKQKPNQMNQNAGVPKKQRYVLFVGNLSYDATPVDLKKHFLTKVDVVKDVRIPSKPGTNTPRGFAYVELENSTDYEKALSLHDTFINGRKINVQYTSSGSKHSGNKQEIVHKNKKLHAMRKAGMLAGSKKTFQKRSFRRNSDRNSKTES